MSVFQAIDSSKPCLNLRKAKDQKEVEIIIVILERAKAKHLSSNMHPMGENCS